MTVPHSPKFPGELSPRAPGIAAPAPPQVAAIPAAVVLPPDAAAAGSASPVRVRDEEGRARPEEIDPGGRPGLIGRSPGSTPREWRIEMPAGMELLNANDRGHWRRRQRLTADLRAAACLLARQQKIPRLERAHILGLYEPSDRRKRDPSNWLPSFKACVDGLTDAGIFSDDDATHVDGPDMRLGDRHPRGRLVLVITELGGET